jgi:energy-coupling factor transporter ATP-binding protein EcfA2
VVENGNWSITADPPDRFIRGRGMQALPEPIRGGSIEELRDFLNLPDGSTGDELFRLIVVWVVAALTALPPYTVLVLTGESGSGKTSTGRALRGIVDPNTAALRNAPKDAQAIALATKANHIVGYDNLSWIFPSISDALCGLATGQAFPTRKLYTTDEEVLFQATRPQILTSITEVVARPDLLSRSLLIELPQMELSKDEKKLWIDYAKAQPRLFGAVLDVLARVLQIRDEVFLEGAPRMADFAITGVAVEKVLGWSDGAFMSAYDRNRALANASALDSAIGQAIVTFFDEKRSFASPEGIVWDGTVGTLLEALNQRADERTSASNSGRRLRGASVRLFGSSHPTSEWWGSTSGSASTAVRGPTLAWRFASPSRGRPAGNRHDRHNRHPVVRPLTILRAPLLLIH